MLHQFPIIKVNDTPGFNTITFTLADKYCPVSFQGFLEKNGVRIGFKTACQSSTTGVLRISYKKPIEVPSEPFKKTIDEMTVLYEGGTSKSNTFFDEVN